MRILISKSPLQLANGWLLRGMPLGCNAVQANRTPVWTQLKYSTAVRPLSWIPASATDLLPSAPEFPQPVLQSISPPSLAGAGKDSSRMEQATVCQPTRIRRGADDTPFLCVYAHYRVATHNLVQLESARSMIKTLIELGEHRGSMFSLVRPYKLPTKQHVSACGNARVATACGTMRTSAVL
jgi:hypothetical protein